MPFHPSVEHLEPRLPAAAGPPLVVDPLDPAAPVAPAPAAPGPAPLVVDPIGPVPPDVLDSLPKEPW